MKFSTLFRPSPLALWVSLAWSVGAQAQEAVAPVPTVLVTASPIVEQQSTDAFGAARTDVGSTQIRELNALDLSSALRRTPGVEVSRFNPVGSFGGDEGGAVFVRGMGSSRPGSEIKTYVDGLPFYMGVWNHALLDLLPVGGMERISVYKGPQPQTFGNTFAAIDLTPRRARGEGLSGQVRLSAGSFATGVEQLDVGYRQGDAEFTLSQSHARSNGHRDDADGQLDNLLLTGALRLTPQWQVGVMALGADNRVSDPGVEGDASTKTGQFTTRGHLASLWLAHEHGDWQGRVQIYSNQGTGHWDNPTSATVHSTFEMSGLRWRERVVPWAGGEVSLGLDVDRMDGSVAFNGYTAFEGETLRLTSPHVALAHTFTLGDGWTATPSAGVRGYDHNVYGHSAAPHAGVVLAQGEALAWRVNVSRGLNHPGLDAALLNAIVPPLAGTPQGWRALQPERMEHAEVGVHWRPWAGTRLDVALFHDRLKDRYVFAFPPAVSQPSFTNLGDYQVRGAEVSWQQQWSPSWSSFVGWTGLNSSLDSLPYAPRHALAAGLTWRDGAWRVSGDVQTQSRMTVLSQARANGATNTDEVGGFGVVNLRAAYALPAWGPKSELFAAVENLGDKRYGYRPGYPMPGRSGLVGVQIGW